MSGKTIVRVEGSQVGWFEHDTYYRGWEYQMHPVASVNDRGEVLENAAGQPRLATIDADGTIRQPDYPYSPMGRVDASGDVRDADNGIVASCEGPEPAKAGGAWLAVRVLSQPASQTQGGLLAALAALAPSGTDPTDPAQPHAEGPTGQTGPVPTTAIGKWFSDWKPGDPYPDRVIPDPDGPGPRGLFGRGPKRAGAFRVGDRVEVTTASFRGIGIVLDVSDTQERGFGTKLYPSFLVHFAEPAGYRGWYNGISLRKVGLS